MSVHHKFFYLDYIGAAWRKHILIRRCPLITLSLDYMFYCNAIYLKDLNIEAFCQKFKLIILFDASPISFQTNLFETVNKMWLTSMFMLVQVWLRRMQKKRIKKWGRLNLNRIWIFAIYLYMDDLVCLGPCSKHYFTTGTTVFGNGNLVNNHIFCHIFITSE